MVGIETIRELHTVTNSCLILIEWSGRMQVGLSETEVQIKHLRHFKIEMFMNSLVIMWTGLLECWRQLLCRPTPALYDLSDPGVE